jgi:hypothetical protein
MFAGTRSAVLLNSRQVQLDCSRKSRTIKNHLELREVGNFGGEVDSLLCPLFLSKLKGQAGFPKKGAQCHILVFRQSPIL